MSSPLPDKQTSRRRFLKTLIILSNSLIALAMAVPGLGFLLTPLFRKNVATWVEIGPSGQFTGSQPVKATFKYMTLAGYAEREKRSFVWVKSRPGGGDGFVAFSAVCSHTGCNVAWRSEAGQFICPCHEGRYDIDGNVVSGPPPSPLTQLPVKVENGRLSIKVIG